MAGIDENCKLSDDFEQLLLRGELSDVQLVIGEKEKKMIPAHKAMLIARSPVFAAMLKGDHFKEGATSRVEITDVEVQVFEQLLAYIYTGRIPVLNRDNASKLLIEADKASDAQ